MGYEFGPRLKKHRLQQNLSQKEFAKRIGVSNSRVSNWEQGINRPDVDFLARICEVLRVSPSELLDVRLDPTDMDEQEHRLVLAYRARPDMHKAVHTLLGIEE